MLGDEILTLLTNILGPLKTQPQNELSGFDKFQDLLKQSLSQPTFMTRKTGLQFPEQPDRLPEKISEELEKLTNAIVLAQSKRKPTDPTWWMRERNISLTAGYEDSPENYVEPEYSFGPFINQQLKQRWFDFYRVPSQYRFQMAGLNIPDFIIITLPTGQPIPKPQVSTTLSLEDCTIWISAKTVTANHDNEYTGFRAKNCVVNFTGFPVMEANGIVRISLPNFQITFQPFDTFQTEAENNNAAKATYPDSIVLSFIITKWTLQSFTKSSLNLNDDIIELKESKNITPAFLETEKLVHLALPSNKTTWEINSNTAERATLYGTGKVANPGWYLPLVSIDPVINFGILGMMNYSGYLGFGGPDGLKLDWPGLENGKLDINKFLILARPGRMKLNYTYAARPRLRQQFSTWKAISGGEARSTFGLKPALAGTGTFIHDNQAMELLIQPVTVTARVDQPLNANQQRFEISGLLGVVAFFKINGQNAVYIVGNKVPPAAGAAKPRRIPQSICLRNALLTTDNPRGIFIEGEILENDLVRQGLFRLVFPVYRLVNTLPDPYISNQDEIFAGDFDKFKELWRTGVDTLPDQFQFTVVSTVTWNDDETSLDFSMNQPAVANIKNDAQLLLLSPVPGDPCSPLNPALLRIVHKDPGTLRSLDVENMTGAYAFLQWLPGDRSLVDVSGSANQWGVAFSSVVFQNMQPFAESLGYPAAFPFKIKNLELVSSGRLSRLFTLPHIQWEPVMQIDNPQVSDTSIPPIINYADNGTPTRLASANKNEVALVPRKIYDFIIEGFNNADKPYGIAAHFTLPFGICAFAYFNPKKITDLPGAIARINEPAFSNKKIGAVNGGMQLHFEAIKPPQLGPAKGSDDHLLYFIGSVKQLPIAGSDTVTILGDIVTGQFNGEFSSSTVSRVPLRRIDFSGYGASIFSNWLNEKANFGMVNQVKFDVLIGRTAHEVIQVKSILFPWGAPVVRSIIMERKNTGLVTRFDTGWVAQGPGEFDFTSHTNDSEVNPYNFHPGAVTGIYNIREIKDAPKEMDIIFPKSGASKVRFTGAYFNGDIEIENVSKGTIPGNSPKPRVHSVGQFGYVMLVDPSVAITDKTTLPDLVTAEMFRSLLNDPKVGGSLGGPVDAVMNIASTGKLMQLTRVDISAGKEAVASFTVSVRGTVELSKEGSWTVVKCLPTKDIVPLTQAEVVPLIRHGLLTVDKNGIRPINFKGSRHSFGDPAEIEKYILNAPVKPLLQYGFLQTTDAQKLLFRVPSFSESTPGKIFIETPDLADSFRLMKCKTIFPNLSQTLSLPDSVSQLTITGLGSGLKLDDSLFSVPGAGLNSFIPRQLSDIGSRTFKLIDEPAFKVFIKYGTEDAPPSFSIDLNSEAPDRPAKDDRKKWETFNKNVTIEVHLGPLQPLLRLTGNFHSEAGKKPVFENPKLNLGPQLDDVKNILQLLAILAMKGDIFSDSLEVAVGNSPDSWNYKMSIEQRIPVIQFPDAQQITLSVPPPLIIEASLLLGVFFNLSLSPDPKNLIKPGAGAVFGFEGMIQILLITLEGIAAYGVGITKVKAYVDFSNPTPQFEFTFGFGATVMVALPVVGMVSVTRSVDLTGSIEPGFSILAGQMLRGVASLAGGLLIVAIQVEARGGVEKRKDPDKTIALFEMIFSLDVGLAFVVKYNFTKRWQEEVILSH